MSISRSLRLLLGLFLLALAAFVARPAHAENVTDWLNDAPAKPADAKGENLGVMADVPDNDVYLLTPEVYEMMRRFAAGELFDMDLELEKLIARRPSLFSLYYYAGMLKVRRLLLAPADTRDDARIEELLNACVEKANRASQLPEFHTAGLFYSAVCESGLGLYEGIRGRYLAAKERGPRCMAHIDEVLAARPHLHGALLLKGMYHFYTGRFGPLVQILLALVGMPMGDEQLGLRMIDEAVSTPSPMRYFTQVYAMYAFAPIYKLRDKALVIADELVKEQPKNYYAYFMRGYVHELRKEFAASYADNLRARSLIPGPPEQYKDIVHRADIFLIDSRLAYLDILLNHSERGLHFLLQWAHKKPGEYDYFDAPLVACLDLGHALSLAGRDDLALAYYRKMQSFPEAQWMKDIGKRYEDLPLGRRIHLPPKQAAALRSWFESHTNLAP